MPVRHSQCSLPAHTRTEQTNSRRSCAKPLFDERQDVLDHVPLGGDFWIEFKTNLVVPPATLGLRSDNREAMLVELVDKRRLVVQPVEMHAVQVEDDVA